jgi:NAD(P)H-hydrate epimerase
MGLIMQTITEIPRLAPRRADAHKGDFGKVCVVAGSLGMSGAAALTARSALRGGAGLVRLAVPKGILPIVAAIEPCCTTIPLDEDAEGRIATCALPAVLAASTQNDVMAVGPGLGIAPGCKAAIDSLICQSAVPVVIDADGLNNLAAVNDWPSRVRARLVLTPHPGEMLRLWRSVFREAMPTDRVGQAGQLAAKTAAVVVLKGHNTVVVDSSRVYVNTTGNPGMATGGSGDVLTGLVAALIGQGLGCFEAAVLGTYLHGLAGDIAAQRLGQASLLATDLIEALPEAFITLQK